MSEETKKTPQAEELAVETNTAGVFLAGVAQGPKDIPSSVAQGSGAAFFDIVQNRTHQIGGFGSTHCSTRHRGKQFGTGQVLTTQVNYSHDVLTHNAPS